MRTIRTRPFQSPLFSLNMHCKKLAGFGNEIESFVCLLYYKMGTVDSKILGGCYANLKSSTASDGNQSKSHFLMKIKKSSVSAHTEEYPEMQETNSIQ